MNLLSIYMTELNTDKKYRSKNRTERIIDRKLVKFAAIAFLFLVIKIAAEWIVESL